MVDDELAGCSLDELEQRLAQLEELEGMVHERRSAVLCELSRRSAWKGDGCRNIQEWAADRCGWSPGTAAARVRVAGHLTAHPQLAKELETGGLSFDRLALICRALTFDNEDLLLESARRLNWAQLVQKVQSMREVPPRDAEDAHRFRQLQWRADDDGITARLWARGPAAQVGRLIAAVQQELASDGKEVIDSEPVVARRFDALVGLAERGITGSQAHIRRTTFVVHIDWDVLMGARDGAGLISRVGVMPADQVRQLIKDAKVQVVWKKDGLPVNLTSDAYQTPPLIYHYLLHHQMVEKQGWTLRGSPDRTIEFIKPTGGRALRA